MTPSRPAKFAVLACFATILTASFSGCRNNGDVSTGPSQLIIVAGSTQQATVGTALPTAPAVRVQDAAGAAVSGVTVRFSVTGGGGTIIGDSARSDADGRAAVGQWILGTKPGTNTLHAQVASTSVAVNVVATSVPGTAVGIRTSSQQGYLALVSHAVTPAPAVLVIDSYGNAVPGTTVSFSVLIGGGVITGASATSDAGGVAQLGSWTLGSAVGANTVRASIPTGATLTFTAQALNSAPVITASSATLQAGYLQFPVANLPRILVTDSAAHPLVGVPVTFTVSSGDGLVSGPIGITGSDGIASPSDWRLGLTSGSLTATIPLSGAAVTFNATGVAASFLIDLRFLTAVNADQRDAFVAAARRWMGIISAHLTSVPLNLPAGACTTLQPALNETVRDVVIYAEVTPIDGIGNVLGSASPCASRSSSGLTIVGTMQFDSADLQAAVATNQLVAIITHEMAHVLGFGTAWPSRNLATGLGGSDPRFTGTETVALWPPFATALGFVGTTPPIENLFGAGTAGAHWRESVFHAELMTGFIEVPGVQMPISRITIASMKDLGYSVDYSQADAFVGNLFAANAVSGPPTAINERINSAKFEISPLGTVRVVH